MADELLISVVIPVYKVESYIADTISSLLRQTFGDFEIILVDDGSPDHSIDIAVSMIEKAKKEYIVVHQQNQGQGFARNIGCATSNGKWVYYLDSDDVIQPFTFELFSSHETQFSESDIVFSRFQYVDEENVFKSADKSESFAIRSQEEMLNGFLVRSIVPLVPGTFYKRGFLSKNDIKHVPIRWSEDQHFMWNVLSSIRSAVDWDCVTYNYLQHDHSIMSSTDACVMYGSYDSFKELASTMVNENVRRFLLSRWVLGCLHSSACILCYSEWKTLFYRLDGRTHMRRLLAFPDYKVRIVAAISCLSDRICYQLFNRRKRDAD